MKPTFPKYPSVPRNSTSGIPESRKLKQVNSARMEGTWDMKKTCFTVYAPLRHSRSLHVGQGVGGVHVLRFTSYECACFHVGWEDLDYPVDREEFLIEKEFCNRKESQCLPTEHPSLGFVVSLTIIIQPGLVIWEVAESHLGPNPCLHLSHPVFCDRPHGMSMFPENSANQSSNSPHCSPSASPTWSSSVSSLNHQFCLLKAFQRVQVTGPPLPTYAIGFVVVSTSFSPAPWPCAYWYMQSCLTCTRGPTQPPLPLCPNTRACHSSQSWWASWFPWPSWE